MLTQDMNRREILKSLVGMTAALMVPGAVLGQTAAPAAPARDRLGELLPQRKLGKTGAMVTMLGLGGHHVGKQQNEADAQSIVETAIAGGVRFFDTAVVYQDGRSEERYGKFLTPKYRDVIFLMTKSRTTEAARTRKDLDDSLRRLKTDYLDLWQMHENTTIDNVDERIDNGVVEVLMDAKAKGKVKHIGFTGHTTPDAHLHMIDRIRKEKNSVLETCQMPINVADPSYSSFILRVLPKLVEEGYGVLAMKTLSGGNITRGRGGANGGIVPGKVSLADALHFVWSLPVSCLISGPDTAAQYQETISIAKSFKMLDEKRRQEIIAAAAPMAGKGVENYKT